MSELNTDQLLVNARKGDVNAQHVLLSKHRDRLKRMISVFVDPRMAGRLDPSDVLQDALTNAAIKLPRYLEEQPIAFYPWLRQIVREQLVTAYRKHVLAERRSVRNEQVSFPGVSDASAMQLAEKLVSRETSPSRQASINEVKQQIRDALNELGDTDRELLLMRFVEQLKIGEIAECISATETAIKSRLSRALQKLNRLMVNHD